MERKVVREAIKSLEKNKKDLDQLSNNPLHQSVKTINNVLLELLKNE